MPGIPSRELLLARIAMVVLATGWGLVVGDGKRHATAATDPHLVAAAALWLATAAPLVRARKATLPPPTAGTHLVLDVAGLSLLLAVSGGAANPFTALYFVPLALATYLSPRWTAGVAGAAITGFALLLAVPAMPGSDAMGAHLRGMWVAFAAAGALVAVAMHRVAVHLSAQRERLGRLERERAEDRHAAALGSLAAGAAHELATPLGTIELLVADLDRMDADERAGAVATIRAQVRRCRRIVDDMASPELVVTATRERIEPFPVADLVAELSDLGPEGVVVVRTTPAAERARLALPRALVLRQIRELVTNALRALPDPPPAGSVEVTLDATDERIEARVADRGAGLTDEDLARAFDPFYSGHADKGGTGLGLFLLRAQMRRLGGGIRLSHRTGGGTLATLTWPRATGDPT